MKTIIIISAIALFLQSCATSPERLAQMDEFNRTIPTCSTEQDCLVKWQAAQVWVTRNSGYRVQIANDVLIQTYGPSGESMALAMSVVKEPTGGSGYRIIVSTSCANIFGCRPNAWESALQFNREISAIGSEI